MQEQVRSIFSKVFNMDLKNMNNEEIIPGKVLLWDSMNHLNFVLSLEESFNIEFTPDEISEMYKGINSVFSIIEKYN